MSSVESTIRHKPRILPSTKAAIIAALGAGLTQSQAAQQFGVHFNSVQRLAKLVRQDTHLANPLKKDWKDTARIKAQKAVERGLEHRSDPIGSANIGLKVLYGIGDLSNSDKLQVDGNVNLQVSWGRRICGGFSRRRVKRSKWR
jgi:hypothetical protein